MNQQWDKRFRDFYPHVKSRFMASVASEHDAEDLAQQVFAEFIGGGNTPGDTEAYIDAIARNVLRQHWRKRARERAGLRRFLKELPRGGSAEAPGSMPAQDHDPEAQFEGGFEGFLGRLPAEHAELLRMRFLDGLSTEQISRKLGCSQDTSRQKLHRAIDRLRKEYRNSGDAPMR